MSTVYEDKGYKNRRDYLESLSEDFDVPLDVVMSIAAVYGKNEDFDGLISSLEDYSEGSW